MRGPHRLGALSALLVAGCTTVPPGAGRVHPDTLPNCSRACGEVGMRLTALVFVENTSGCVCEPVAPASTAAAGGPSTGTPRPGTAAIAGGQLIAQEERRRAEDRQRSEDRRAGSSAGHSTPGSGR